MYPRTTLKPVLAMTVNLGLKQTYVNHDSEPRVMGRGTTTPLQKYVMVEQQIRGGWLSGSAEFYSSRIPFPLTTVSALSIPNVYEHPPYVVRLQLENLPIKLLVYIAPLTPLRNNEKGNQMKYDVIINYQLTRTEA